jgi:hypothetical protein
MFLRFPDPRSSVSIRGRALPFRSRAMSAIPAITAIGALCAPQPSACVPSARDPPPPYRFVENKSQSAIRPNGHRTVEALFLSFLPVESVSFCWSFCSCNPLPTHRSAVGRKRSGGVLWLIASCQLLAAHFQRSLPSHPGALPHSRRSLRANQVRKRTMSWLLEKQTQSGRSVAWLQPVGRNY